MYIVFLLMKNHPNDPEGRKLSLPLNSDVSASRMSSPDPELRDALGHVVDGA